MFDQPCQILSGCQFKYSCVTEISGRLRDSSSAYVLGLGLRVPSLVSCWHVDHQVHQSMHAAMIHHEELNLITKTGLEHEDWYFCRFKRL